MFNISQLLVELKPAEKSYTFSFKDSSLGSILLNPSDIIPKQNPVEKHFYCQL